MYFEETFETVDGFSEAVRENKKSLYGETVGNTTFGGAGGKAILLNTPNGKEFVSYDNAFNGKGKYGKLLHQFFFGGENDKMTVSDILALIDENLSDEDVMFVIDTLEKGDAPQKLSIGDVLGLSNKAINVQMYFDKIVARFEDKLSKISNSSEHLAKAKADLMAVAICDYYNDEYDFMKFDFDANDDNVHIVYMSKFNNLALRESVHDGYYLFSTIDVDALAKHFEREGEHFLFIKVFV